MSQPTGEPVTPTEPTPAAPVAPVEPAPTSVAPAAFDPASLSPEAKAWLESERRRVAADEAAKARTTSKANAREETLREIAEKMGIAPVADPAKLAEQLTAENRKLKIDAAIRSAAGAPEVRGDADLIGALLAHQGRTADLDPSAPDFADKVAALVAAQVAANPRLKLDVAPPVTAATQGAVGGFNGQQQGPRVADLSGAIGAYYNRNTT